MSDAVKNRPWIDECYLSRLPRYDPELYSIVQLSCHTARLRFSTAFNLLLFINQVVGYSIYSGRAWDKLIITALPDGKFMLRITVKSKPEQNRMEVKFTAGS